MAERAERGGRPGMWTLPQPPDLLWLTVGKLSTKLYLINRQNGKKGNRKLSDATLAQSYGCSYCSVYGPFLEEFILLIWLIFFLFKPNNTLKCAWISIVHIQRHPKMSAVMSCVLLSALAIVKNRAKA